MYKKLLTVILSFFIFASLTLPAFAAQDKLKGDDCLFRNNVVTIDCVMPLFANAVYWLFIMSGVVAVFFIAYGGIKYLTSSGEAKAVDSARKVITYAIIGLIVIISSFMIVNIIADLTRVSCISEFGFDSCSTSGAPPAEVSECRCVRTASDCTRDERSLGSDLVACTRRVPICCAPDDRAGGL